MAFRSSEYVQRYKMVRYRLDDTIRLPANGQHQQKNGYKFTVNDRSNFYDQYNEYFEVQFQVQVLANGNGYPAAADEASLLGALKSIFIFRFYTRDANN